MRFFSKAPLLAGLASAGLINTINTFIRDKPVQALSSWSYTNCGDKTDAITLHSFTLTPDPPVVGSPLTATLDFTANREILEGAYIEIAIKVSFLTLLTTTIDLCGDGEDGVLTDTGVSCPIAAGDYVMMKNVDLPAEIPAMEFEIEARGHTYDNAVMFCVDVVADFSAAAVVYREGL